MAGNTLEDVKKIIKSLVLAQQNGLGPIALNNEFQEMEGRSIPYQSFGAMSLIEFLKTLTDILTPGHNKAGEPVFFARADASTAHIAKLVAYQRSAATKRRTTMIRNDEKRLYRPQASAFVPSPPPPSPPHPLHPVSPPEWTRSRKFATNGNGDRRRELERNERRREPSPMDISPPPRRSPTPEPERYRGHSPPRRGRSHSFRDSSPDRTRNRSTRDVSPPPKTTSSSTDYESVLQKARERRGLPQQRSRRSKSRSPSPRRSRYRQSSPPSRRSPSRTQTKTVSCQTELDKVDVKNMVSVSCQTDLPTPSPVKPKHDPRSRPVEIPIQVDHSEDPEQDLNAAYYGPNTFGINYNNNPYNSQSYVLVPDPSYEEDKSHKGHYYDFDAGALKPIPFVLEWYAHWIWNGWVPPTNAQQQLPQQPQSFQQVSHPYQQQYPSLHFNFHQPQMQQNSISDNHFVNQAPAEPVPQSMKVIPITPTIPSSNTASRDPRLARQTAALAAKEKDKQPTVGSMASARRKALTVNDYMKTRKLGSDKCQHIVNEETSEFPDRLNNSPDQQVKLGPKRG